MRPISRLAVAALALATILVGSTAYADVPRDETVTLPSAAASSHETAIIEALKLIRSGNFDGFINKWCHKGKLCTTAQAKASLKRYNLPALKRLAPKCLKEGDKLQVTRVKGDPAKDVEVKVFIVCDPRGMPRPFTLRNDEGGWKHIRI